MIENSVDESRTERLIRAFLAGADDEMILIRGRGLSADERDEYEEIAREMHEEPVAPAPVVAA